MIISKTTYTVKVEFPLGVYAVTFYVHQCSPEFTREIRVGIHAAAKKATSSGRCGDAYHTVWAEFDDLADATACSEQLEGLVARYSAALEVWKAQQNKEPQ